MAASATFALKAGVWFRRGRLFMVSPVHGDYRRCQAETPLSDLFKFAEPALSQFSKLFRRSSAVIGGDVNLYCPLGLLGFTLRSLLPMASSMKSTTSLLMTTAPCVCERILSM